MNRVAVVLLALVTIIAFVAISDDGDESNPGYAQPTVAPDVNDTTLGSVELISSGNGQFTYRAIPAASAFIGWFNGSEIVSTSERLTMADFEGIVAVFGKASTKTVEYAWDSPGFDSDGKVSDISIHHIFRTEIPVADYISSINSKVGRTATMAAQMPTHRLADDQVISDILAHLAPIVEGMNDYQRAETVLAFVQDVIRYESDMEQYGVVEFWTTPMETIYSGKGDCEDTAALFVNIAIRMGLSCGFVAFDDPKMGHMSAAVQVSEGFVGTTFVSEGVTYAYVETAVDGLDLPVGILNGYDIDDGKWTLVNYTVDGYSDNGTVPIGVIVTDTTIGTYGRL